MSLLESIQSPADVKRLPRSRLPELAAEVRKLIVEVVSHNGGHLASSLGAVELAIAIHYVFDAPQDKVIWDVGHQAYAHKILTGRREAFPTLRRHGGLSGFTRRGESPYDSFTTGHSSTSISAGFGMACAKALKKEDAKVVAVIGDGSLTAGIAYEGLNQAGGIPKRDLIVILNDNEMSISRNVGALSSFLSRTFSAKKLQELRRELGFFFKKLPRIGEDIYQLAKRTEESFKSFVTPGMLFEAFNFEYFGPINGHNIDHLIDILNNIKYIREPVLLHVSTTKGKGYAPAEKNPVYFHGCGAFDADTGTCRERKPAAPTYTEVFGRTLLELAAKDSRIVAVTAAMPEGTGLSAFAQAYPERFFDVGIAEQHAVTFAAGLAAEGFRPVVAIYSTFLQRAFDQVMHDVTLQDLHVVFVLDRGGVVGADGPTHHGALDLSYLRCIQHMVVMAPKDEQELRDMLFTAVAYEGPVALRYARGNALGVPVRPGFQRLEIGKGEVVRKGTDVALLAIGSMVHPALKAAELLSHDGIDAEVLNMRFVKPIDEDLLRSVGSRFKNVVTIEENVTDGGFGSAVLEGFARLGITNVAVRLHGLPNEFVEQGTPAELLRLLKLDGPGIAEITKAFLSETHSQPSLGTVHQ